MATFPRSERIVVIAIASSFSSVAAFQQKRDRFATVPSFILLSLLARFGEERLEGLDARSQRRELGVPEGGETRTLCWSRERRHRHGLPRRRDALKAEELSGETVPGDARTLVHQMIDAGFVRACHERDRR